MEDANDEDDTEDVANEVQPPKLLRKFVTAMEYYSYQFQFCPRLFNPLLRCGRLFHQYMVDMYVKIESNHLNFLKKNQRAIRSELYQGKTILISL